MIQKIDQKLYNEFRDYSFRYFEIYRDVGNKSLVFSAMMNFNLGIQDINRLINKINDGEYRDSGWYYELIIKSYQILNTFDEIEKEFKIVKSGYNDLYGQEDENDAIMTQ